jgi:hypothetical protein
MKKICFIFAICFAAASTAFAGVDIRLNTGMALPAMEDFNDFLVKLSDNRTFVYPDGKKIESMQFGMYANLDILFKLIPNLCAGPRVGYGFYFQSMVENKNTGLNWDLLSKFDAYIIPLMLGLELSVPVPKTDFLITAGGFGGYGFAGLNETQTFTSGGFSRTANVPYTGGGFTGDVYCGFVYKTAGFFSLGINAGYRAAIMTVMNAGADSTNKAELNVLKGDEFKDPSGNAVPLDYSGVNFGLSLKFEF